MAKATITQIGLQTGTTRTVFATWTWTKRDQTDKYDVRWYYGTGDGIRFIGNQEQVEITNAQLQSTYTPPENAYVVKLQVKPIAKTRKVNDKDIAYWTAEWSTEAVYYFSNNPPTTPGIPNVVIDDYTLTTSLENLNVGGNQIQFQVVKDDSTIFNSGIANIVTSSASYSCSVTPGSKYKVRCRAKKNDMYSGWTEYSANVDTIPATPKEITSCHAISDTAVFMSWSSISSSTSYDIEYATNPDYLGNSNASTTINNITNSQYTITGLTTGQKYYFRVRAVNEKGESAWSNSSSVIIGTKPVAPTTWSSTTTATIGEQVVLYWIHNTEDGSSEHYAEVEMYVNGTKYTYTVKNENKDEEKNSFYTVNTSRYSDGATINWRVRTAGITLNYGEWSIQRTVNIYAPATLELHITDKSGDDVYEITSFPFFIKGIAGPDNQTVIGYHVSITSNSSYETIDEMGNVKMINAGDEVYSKFYDVKQELILELTAGSIDLENNIKYTVNCISTMDTGIAAQESRTFMVAWSENTYEPNAEIGYDPETLSAYIRPYCEDINGNLIGDITLSVYRRQYDGGFIEIGKGLTNTNSTFVTDPHPSLDYGRYRIVAVDNTTGSVSYSDIPGYPIGEKAIIIQWGEKWINFDDLGELPQEPPAWSGSMLKLPYNIDVSDSNSADVSFIEYIGRSHPVSYYGTQLGSTSTWKVDIDKKDKKTLYSLRRLATWMGDVYVREPSGSGYWANISVSFDQTHRELVIPVTLNITRVEGGI